MIKNIILQIPDSETADKNFIIQGWKINDVKAGVRYIKNIDKVGTKMEKTARVSENTEIVWKVSRNNLLPALRSLIPLAILLFLSWYCSFLTIESASTTVALNTTVFLAGVALYFSAERPSGNSLTIIDKFFIGFYLALGTVLLSEFTLFISEEIYIYSHMAWQIILPILFSGAFIFLYSKYRSVFK